ncbi:MAG: class I SAM-dependent methyltransferase [Blastocatellia bacterium]
MQNEDFEYLYALEERFWWFAGMREITASLLDPLLAEMLPEADRTILDAGCGTGGNLEWLVRYSGKGRVIGIDTVPLAIEFCRQRNHPMLSLASATDLPFADESFDLVTSFDVLVQIPGEGTDDQSIDEMWRVLKPGGIAFVRGPAYRWMRSGHDEALDTVRRYTLGELRGKLERVGFQLLRETYANSLLFPAVAVRRLLFKPLGLADGGSDVKPLPPNLDWLNRLLTKFLLVEARLLKNPKVQLPAGLSVICIVQKPA